MTGASGNDPGAAGNAADDTGATPTALQLLVSGGGSSQVATDIVFAEMALLRLVQNEADGWREQLARVSALGVGSMVHWRPNDLGACLLGATTAITRVAERSRELADSLVEAAEHYDRLENGLDEALRLAASGIGYQVGLVTRLLGPLLLLGAVAPALGVATGSVLANLALGRPASLLPPWLADAVRDNPRLLTSPVTVAIVRMLVTSADDAGMGAVGLPYPLAAALGDDGAELIGVQSSALGVLVAARAVGMMRETPVRVHRVGASAGVRGGPPGGLGRARAVGPAVTARALPKPGFPLPTSLPPSRVPNGSPDPVPTRTSASAPLPVSAPVPARRSVPAPLPLSAPASVPAPLSHPKATASEVVAAELAPPSPPTGFADLADRIPGRDDGGQVRIERYGDALHPSWVVYIGGTVEWSPTASTEPWDMASNVAAVADQDAGSYRAVLLALTEAGVQPGDPVLPVAHSQGGLIANELVSRGDIHAVGLVTFGAPETPLVLPDTLQAIAVEHSDDLVPAVGGHGSDDDTRLYVRRELFAGREVPPNDTLPAHQMVGYRDTARLLDGSPEPRLVAFREQLSAIVGTSPGQQSVWRGERIG